MSSPTTKPDVVSVACIAAGDGRVTAHASGCGTLVRLDGADVLIGCGEGTARLAFERLGALWAPDLVVLPSAGAHHWLDLVPLRLALTYGSHKRESLRPALAGRAETLAAIERGSDAFHGFEPFLAGGFDLCELVAGVSAHVRELELEVVAVSAGSGVDGIRIHGRTGSVGYLDGPAPGTVASQVFREVSHAICRVARPGGEVGMPLREALQALEAGGPNSCTLVVPAELPASDERLLAQARAGLAVPIEVVRATA